MEILRAYVDTVSTAPPDRKARETWRGHAVRISIAVEQGRAIIRRVNLQVAPDPGWPLDAAWCRRYGASAEDAKQTGHDVRDAAALVSAALQGVGILVAHSVAFHRGVIEQLYADGGAPGHMPSDTFDTMARSVDTCRLPDPSSRGFKRPKLWEAAAHFTGERMPDISAPDIPWWQAGLHQITAVRRVYWGLHRWGVAPEIAAEPQT